MSIQSLFAPRGVAVVGSASPGKLGYELIGQIVPVTLGDILPEDMIRSMDAETLKQLDIKF